MVRVRGGAPVPRGGQAKGFRAFSDQPLRRLAEDGRARPAILWASEPERTMQLALLARACAGSFRACPAANVSAEICTYERFSTGANIAICRFPEAMRRQNRKIVHKCKFVLAGSPGTWKSRAGDAPAPTFGALRPDILRARVCPRGRAASSRPVCLLRELSSRPTQRAPLR